MSNIRKDLFSVHLMPPLGGIREMHFGSQRQPLTFPQLQMFTTVYRNFKTALRQLVDTRSLWKSHGVN